MVENGAIIRGDEQLIPSAARGGLENGYLRIIKYLHEHGADIDAKPNLGMTGLGEAAYGGNFPIVQYLVDNGVDVNARMAGWSALKWAKHSPGNFDSVYRARKPEMDAIIAYLLANGAS